MADVQALPANVASGAAPRTGSLPPATLTEARSFIGEALARALPALPATGAGEAAGSAVARLLERHGVDGEAAAGRIADLMAGPVARPWPQLLYEAAGGAVADGQMGAAMALLCALAATPGGRSDGLLGLAVCAVRLSSYEDALILALDSRGPRPGHPRASFIAGLCELERGNRRAARAHLAAAARLARGRPECRDDLRQAQRSLLLMHLA